MRLSPISYFRILNAMLTATNTGIGASELSAPFSWLIPLIIGVMLQGIGEAIAELTPSGAPGIPNPLKTPIDQSAAALIHSVRESQAIIDPDARPNGVK